MIALLGFAILFDNVATICEGRNQREQDQVKCYTKTGHKGVEKQKGKVYNKEAVKRKATQSPGGANEIHSRRTS